MKFQSKWRNALYVVRPTTKVLVPGFGVQYTKGLMAKFTGDHRIFDSEAAQATLGWTDEEREQVERHLLSHPDFGNGLYLAPGETLPEDKKALVKNQGALAEPRRRCMKVFVEGNAIKQCSEEAGIGRDFCPEHDPDKTRIIQGMMTTKD